MEKSNTFRSFVKMELRDLDPSGVGLHSLPLRGRCHGDAVTEGAPCRWLGSYPASFGLISLCSRLFPFHDFGIGGIGASVFCLDITALGGNGELHLLVDGVRCFRFRVTNVGGGWVLI